MAKKKIRPNIQGSSVSSASTLKKAARDKNGAYLTRFPHIAIILLIAAVTWLCFKNILNNQFTNWDDPGYILDNELVKNLSLSGLKNIFLTPAMGHYHPLTILSYAIEYHFAHDGPWLYHFDSLACHMVVAISVYGLAYLLTYDKLTALVTALLFGIQPMHVEPVAWAAGRKDLLCALFYFSSCIAYLFFVRSTNLKKRWLWYTGVFVFFICSMLSKPVAVTLPIVLLLIDYYEKRSWKIAVLVEKIPFFLLALVSGIMAIKLNHAGETTQLHPVSYSFMEHINLLSYALIIYIWKAFVLLNLHNFYTYPAKVNGSLPGYYFIYPLILAALALCSWHFMRKQRTIVFGLLFFIINILLLIKFVSVGDVIVAERYTYIPYFGLFFIAAFGLSNLWKDKSQKYQSLKTPLAAIAVLLMCGYGFLTTQRCAVWHDNISLWSDEILKDPNDAEAYNNRANEYLNEKKYDTALLDYNQALITKADYVEAFYNRGVCNFFLKKYDDAIKDYSSAIQIKPDYVLAYYNRGSAYASLKQYNLAIKDYDSAIQISPNYFEVYKNRGAAYNDLKQFDKAIKDYSTAIQIKHDDAAAFHGRGRAYAGIGQYSNAITDYTSALQITPQDATIFVDRGTAYANLQRFNDAIKDYNSAIQIAPGYAIAYGDRYLANFMLKKYRPALADALMAKQLGFNIDDATIQSIQNNTNK